MHDERPSLIIAHAAQHEGMDLASYLKSERQRIAQAAASLAPGGSLVWQSSYVPGQEPLDLHLGPLLRGAGLQLRNELIWAFGADPPDPYATVTVAELGYRVLQWCTKPGDYWFDVSAARVPQRYPQKKAWRGHRKGTITSNPAGKNPGTVWFVDPREAEVSKIFPPTVVHRLMHTMSPPGEVVAALDDPDETWHRAAVEAKRRLLTSLPGAASATEARTDDPLWESPVGARRKRVSKGTIPSLPAMRATIHTDDLVQPDFRLDGAPVTLFHGDARTMLATMPPGCARLIVTSPPYNLGRSYEGAQRPLLQYRDEVAEVVEAALPTLDENGCFVWQVGMYARDGVVVPLQQVFHEVFRRHGFRVHRRVVWYYRHGEMASKRFSPRHEVALFYVRGDKPYYDPLQIPEGDSPVWDMRPVSAGHPERSAHPNSYPVEFVQRCIVSRTRQKELPVDPFAGVFTTCVGATLHGRPSAGAELVREYVEIGEQRVRQAAAGILRYRDMRTPKGGGRRTSSARAGLSGVT